MIESNTYRDDELSDYNYFDNLEINNVTNYARGRRVGRRRGVIVGSQLDQQSDNNLDYQK